MAPSGRLGNVHINVVFLVTYLYSLHYIWSCVAEPPMCCIRRMKRFYC